MRADRRKNREANKPEIQGKDNRRKKKRGKKNHNKASNQMTNTFILLMLYLASRILVSHYHRL